MKKDNKLTKLLEEAGPYLAAGVSDDVSIQEVSHIQQKGLDIAELRIDHYSQKSPVYILNEIEKFGSLATIATIRTEKEGKMEWRRKKQV